MKIRINMHQCLPCSGKRLVSAKFLFQNMNHFPKEIQILKRLHLFEFKIIYFVFIIEYIESKYLSGVQNFI
jgi:hypothetical protein